MPRYTMVTPQFTPVDYATRIRPLEQYKEEYDKRADALDEQGVLADAIGGLIDENKDPELAEQYRQFSDRLSSTVTNLMSTGDLGASRRDLSALRRSYANELVPIKTAYEDRAKDAEAFRNKKLQDPTFIGKDPLTHGLTEYLHGNKPNDKFVSGEVLYNAGAADAKAASSRRVIREKWGLDKGLGSQYFSQMIYQGWSQEEVQDALKAFDPTATDAEITEASDAVKYLQDATDRIGRQARLDEFGDDTDSINQSKYYILNGLLSGMTYKEDADYKNYDPSMWIDYQLKRKKLAGEDETTNDYLPYEIVPMVDASGMIDTDRANKDLQFLSDVIANPNKIGENTVYFRGTPEEYGVDNTGTLTEISRRYGIDLQYSKDNTTGKYTIDRDSFTKAAQEINRRIADAALINNVAQYNTQENKNLVEHVNDRAATTKGLKHVKKNGTTESVERLPDGGVFRLNPSMQGNSLYFEYVVTQEGKSPEIYRVPMEAVSNVSATYVQAYKQAIEEYKKNPTEENLQRANTARHNAMVDAYTAVESGAKVRSKTDSKL